ncbi:MAG: PEP-CTERM sorting domain-containing protein [Planctomycetota bacterium]|jgi:hypothetical protein
MMMKNLWMPVFIPAWVMLCSLNAFAITETIVDGTFTLEGCCGGSDTVTVDSWVEPSIGAAGYTYYYQITATDIYVDGFSVFVDPFNDVVNDGSVGALPAGPLESTPISMYETNPEWEVDWNFKDLIGPIGSPAPTAYSAVLYFTSDYMPTLGQAQVSGKTANFTPVCACGDVYVPNVPEPTTMAMLVMGCAGIVMKRKHS